MQDHQEHESKVEDDHGPNNLVTNNDGGDKQLSPCLEKNPSLEDSQSMPVLDAQLQSNGKRNGNQSSQFKVSPAKKLEISSATNSKIDEERQPQLSSRPVVLALLTDESSTELLHEETISQQANNEESKLNIIGALAAQNGLDATNGLADDGPESAALDSRNTQSMSPCKSAQGNASAAITQQQQQRSQKDRGAHDPTATGLQSRQSSNSNYDASIYADDDDSSSDILEDSDKDTHRRSLGTAQAQEQPNVHLGSGQLLTMNQAKTGTLAGALSPKVNSSKSLSDDGMDVTSGKHQQKKADAALTQPSADGAIARQIITNPSKAGAGESLLEKLEPMPLIKSGVSIAADMRFGWKPQMKETHGAPIPLHYDFEPFKVPMDPATNKPYSVMFLGLRMRTSIDVHKKFANIENLTIDECPEARPKGKAKEPYGSYNFKFPLKTPYMLPHSFDERPAFTGMNPKMEGLEDELSFDSSFESGNLDMVIKPKPANYDLYMRVDTNTRGHHQWFYFSVEVPESMMKQTVTFKVVNFTKPHSLYTSGMRVCYAKKSQNYNWVKGGTNIKYGRSHLVRRPSADPTRVIYYSMLTFSFEFERSKDTKMKDNEKIYFAYCFPYSFTMLQNFLRETNLIQKDSDIFKESIFCYSLSGVEVPLLTITSRMKTDPKSYNQIKLSEFEDDDSKLSLPMYKKKKYAIIGARVHPGESNSSYMMQGFIKYLLGDSHQAKQLRKRVVFKIVPMINPDGVIIGNYRTSMSGNDLNRRYVKPDFRIHPTVCAIKQLASDLIYGPDEETKQQKDKEFPPTMNEEILAFVDMHGHSRKKNVFIYGPQEPLHSDKYLKMRIIPKLIAEESAKFRYHSCRFRLEQSKLKAARIVMWRDFGIMNCFTFEASFHGYFDHDNLNFEFTQTTYEEMGEHLANSLFEYLMIMEEEERRRKLKEIAKKKKKKQKQLAAQQAAKMAKEAVAHANEVTGKTGGQQTSSQGINSTTDKTATVGASQKELGNYLNLPPSGKSGKKGTVVVGSSSSRARNISHITNKESEKEYGLVKKGKRQLNNGKDEQPVSSAASRQQTQKENSAKKKTVLIKSDVSSSMEIAKIARNVISSQDQARDNKATRAGQAATNNPNEPPTSELNVSGSEADPQTIRTGNIQVGSHDLRQSSNEISRYTNTQLDQYEQELTRQNEARKPRHGFRNLKDMFAAVREQEQSKKKKQPVDEQQVDETDGNSDCMSEEVSDNPPEEAPVADDELDDELSKEQQRKLHGDILNAITQFVKINNYKEHEYYGVSKQTLKKQKKVRANQVAAALAKEKEQKGPPEVVEKAEKPHKKQSQKKRQSYQKDSGQAGGQSSSAHHHAGVNYQSNTLSVAQKRRSFNIAETAGVPMKQVITNEQLNQQLQHMGGNNRLKGGLSSPLYYNLYQSTSNFSNFYVYRFDERGKPMNNFQQQLMQQTAQGQQHQQQLQGPMIYDGQVMAQEYSPKRSGKHTLQQQNTAQFLAQQQALQQLAQQANHQQQQTMIANGQQPPQPPQGYHSIQNNETGKIYHLSKNVDGTGNHHLISSSKAAAQAAAENLQQNANMMPVGQYGGAFGSRRSHTKEHMQAEQSLRSIMISRDPSQQNRQQHQQQQVTTTQIHQMTAAQHNSNTQEINSQLEQMRHSQQQQAVQPMIFNFFNSKNEVKQRNHHNREKHSDRNNGNQGAYTGAGSYPRSHDQHHNRTTKFAAASSDVRSSKAPQTIPATGKRDNLLEGALAVGPTVHSYNQTMLGMNQGHKISPSVTSNERYPVPLNQNGVNQFQLGHTNNTNIYRQKNGVRSVTNPTGANANNNNPAQQTGLNNGIGGLTNSGKNGGAGQKSRSSFNTRKQHPTALQQQKNEQDVCSSNALASNAMTPMTKTQQQTKSAKFANIVAAAEIMKTTSQMADQQQNSQSLNAQAERFQTLPKQSLTHHPTGSNRLIIDQMSQSNTTEQQQKRLKHNGIRQQPISNWGPDLQQQANQQTADQPFFENSELKRNAIRQIHPLKTFNQIPTSSGGAQTANRTQTDNTPMMMVSGTTAQAMMSATQDKFNSHHPPHNTGLIQRHLLHHQHNNQSSKQVGAAISQAIPQVPSPTRGIRDRAGSYHKVKAPTAKPSGQLWQLDPQLTQDVSATDRMISNMNGNYSMARVPTTSAGVGMQALSQPVKHRMSYQPNGTGAGGDAAYQYQLHPQIGAAALSTANMSYLQGNAVATKDILPAPFATNIDSASYGQQISKRPLQSTHSCDSASAAEQKKNAVEIRKKLSQLSATPVPQDEKQSNKMTGGSSTIGLKKESQRLTNDHSSLRRSGDYQTKMHKQISLDPVSQQLLLGNTGQSSTEVIPAGQQASEHTASTKPKLGQRVPPDLYQKNPYTSSQHNQILTQRLVSSHNTSCKSELRMDGPANEDATARLINSPSRGQNNFINQTTTSLIPDPSGGRSRADMSTHQQFDTELSQMQMMQRTSQVQRSRIINQAQKFDTNYQAAQGQLPLSKQKLTVTQHTQQQIQNNNVTSSLQHTPSQGIQNIFADPNYGIVGVHDATSAANSVMGVPGASAAQRRHIVQHHYTPGSHHMLNENEQFEQQVSTEPQGINDMKALWIKSSQSNQQQLPHQQQSSNQNNMMSGSELKNTGTVLLDSSQAGSPQKTLPNGSIIRIQKAKYQGLIKQRGAPIVVHSSGQTSENTSQGGNNRNGDGFDSPQRMAQIQQIYNLNQQHQSKRLQQQQLYEQSDELEQMTSAQQQQITSAQQQYGSGQKKYSLSSKPGSGLRKLEMVAVDATDNNELRLQQQQLQQQQQAIMIHGGSNGQQQYVSSPGADGGQYHQLVQLSSIDYGGQGLRSQHSTKRIKNTNSTNPLQMQQKQGTMMGRTMTMQQQPAGSFNLIQNEAGQNLLVQSPKQQAAETSQVVGANSGDTPLSTEPVSSSMKKRNNNTGTLLIDSASHVAKSNKAAHTKVEGSSVRGHHPQASAPKSNLIAHNSNASSASKKQSTSNSRGRGKGSSKGTTSRQ